MKSYPSVSEAPTLNHLRYNLTVTENGILRFSVMWQDEQFTRKAKDAYPRVHVPKNPKLFWVVSSGYPDLCLLECAASRMLTANKIFIHGCAATTKPTGSSHLNPDNSRVVFLKVSNPSLVMQIIRESLLDWDANWKGWK